MERSSDIMPRCETIETFTRLSTSCARERRYTENGFDGFAIDKKWVSDAGTRAFATPTSPYGTHRYVYPDGTRQPLAKRGSHDGDAHI